MLKQGDRGGEGTEKKKEKKKQRRKLQRVLPTVVRKSQEEKQKRASVHTARRGATGPQSARSRNSRALGKALPNGKDVSPG